MTAISFREAFPGVQLLDAPTRTLMLQSYVRDVIARDIVERSSRLDVTIATQMALFVLRDTACEFSVNRLLEMLRKVDYRTSWETVNEGVHMLSSACFRNTLSHLQRRPLLFPRFMRAIRAWCIPSRMQASKTLERGTRPDMATSYTVLTTGKVNFLVGDSLAVEPYLPIQVTTDMTLREDAEILSTPAAYVLFLLGNGPP
jgi:hypothetical protein